MKNKTLVCGFRSFASIVEMIVTLYPTSEGCIVTKLFWCPVSDSLPNYQLSINICLSHYNWLHWSASLPWPADKCHTSVTPVSETTRSASEQVISATIVNECNDIIQQMMSLSLHYRMEFHSLYSRRMRKKKKKKKNQT